ncbi:MAG: penicillin-binding protein 2 [Alphaproteobacteria bacterium]|nr:penicillin-binding protein 2 [Alphaproteobacteria bacterium]
MHKFKDFRSLIFSRRAFILVALKCVILFCLGVRLFFLQILKSDKYKTLSEKNRIKFFLIEPKRGEIKDERGLTLAENKLNYQLYFYKQRNQKHKKVLDDIFNLLKIKQDERSAIIKEVDDSSYLYPVMIQDSLTWNQIVKIESNSSTLPGTYISKGYIRFYPMKEMLAHVLGYVGIPTKEEVKEYNLQHASGFRIGKTGVEKVKNPYLIGEFGMKKVEVNAYRSVVRELEKEPSTKGKDISLTINQKLQNHAYNVVRKNGGAAVVIDIENGNVLSLVSRPSFDPNKFSMPISHKDWSNIINNKRYPLNNRAIGTLYPPGSVWKIISGLAILESGISANKKVVCSGSTKVGNQEYKCWKKSGHGPMDLKSAIYNSCNVYFYELGQKAGINNIHKVADILGFGKQTGIELPGESAGINPSRWWKEKTYNNSWLIGDTVNTSIGQGYNLVTPMQLATMSARVASGLGISPKLYLGEQKGNEYEKLSIAEKNLEIMRDSMSGVFNNRNGSGYNIRITEKKYRLAGKAGTAQVVSQDTVHSTIRSIRSHAMFAGYAPIDNPKYAVAAVADNAGWGIKNAAPIGIDILYFAQTEL